LVNCTLFSVNPFLSGALLLSVSLSDLLGFSACLISPGQNFNLLGCHAHLDVHIVSLSLVQQFYLSCG
jgi:hypothetical protein